LGIETEIVGYSDIDKYANQCFRQNHIKEIIPTLLQFFNPLYGELGDVKKIKPEELIDFDLLTGGFPCQAFSTAGKMKGETDARGTLFYEIIRIAEVKKPRYMLLENVKGLTCKKFKDTFDKILSELARIGYKVHWKVLNTKDYGIPQSRARVWFVCFREQEDYDKFKFPEQEELKILVDDIRETDIDKKYYLSKTQQERLLKGIDIKKQFSSLNSDIAINQTARQYASWRGNFIIADRYRTLAGKGNCVESRSDGCTNSISTVQKDNLLVINLQPRNGKGQGGKGILFKQDGTVYCIDKGNNQVLLDGNIRRLTPKECFRLQGFLNDEINLEGLSDTQRYKLAGNGQSVNVVEKIFKEMFK
jgi:DNA (cytosine-5)-methyltransferase 1